jgi:hypothetical protein
MRTALAQKHPDSESTDMAQNESTELATEVAELRADVRHVQAESEERFERRDKKIDDLDKKTEARFERLERTIQEIRLDVKESLASAKLWAFGMYVALAGTLLYVIARAAKWI